MITHRTILAALAKIPLPTQTPQEHRAKASDLAINILSKREAEAGGREVAEAAYKDFGLDLSFPKSNTTVTAKNKICHELIAAAKAEAAARPAARAAVPVTVKTNIAPSGVSPAPSAVTSAPAYVPPAKKPVQSVAIPNAKVIGRAAFFQMEGNARIEFINAGGILTDDAPASVVSKGITAEAYLGKSAADRETFAADRGSITRSEFFKLSQRTALAFIQACGNITN